MRNYPDDLDLKINVSVTTRNPYQISIYDNSSIQNKEQIEVYNQLYCLEIIIAGQKELIKNTQKFSLHQNELVVLSPGLYQIKEHRGIKSIMIFFNYQFIEDFIDQNLKNLDYVKKNISMYHIELCNSSKTQYLQLIDAIFREKHYYPCLSRTTLQQIFLSLFTRDKDNSFRFFLLNTNIHQFSSLPVFMNQNITSSLSNQELAKLCGKSLSVFNREFRSIFHTTPQKWIIEKRLELARKLILITNKSITEISFELGFADPSHFTKKIKTKYKMSPSELRKKLRDQK